MLRICAAFVLMLAAWPAVAGPQGSVRVVDGDTLKVGGVTVRLHGIDAPETDQFCGGDGAPPWACGSWVRNELRGWAEGRNVSCRTVDTDRYGRVVAKCYLDGQDIGQRLVRDGLAFAYRRYSLDYDLDEKGAAVNGRGLHGTGIQSPAAFRRAARTAQGAANLDHAPDGCVIKGNISSDGQRIYHMPGQAWYGRTRISPAKGERWFCSESQARNAGWRRAAR
ncbi:thermonuclease family protein [Lutimaribacter sp. EGI FJ00015]|uniref:Thermonuclease family protein n=1 Tax=Lutimaribacter degradans TaxID=2945989 RepID=A0ACC5ZQJ3_9RHOB|nr:thermonuclease family protein [Lutimaribacter sp. EGI FJ00013]MCM2560537.1 thermonuclease family protein [Lutimaribacter sp. EGI FJ00013]MCO0612519.1 thermonuclease family protein [Lutimaribacter sp. EGI FJ00015]MCO0634361.1 thermonuclease family protein [Lutimaribacter sp. EGI FJ00014]